MKNLNDLISSVLAEAKEQENKRKEYLSLVHGLIEGTEGKLPEYSCRWRISFKYYSDCMGRTFISFSQNVSGRENGLSKYDIKNLEGADKEIDKCINYLLDFGEEATDAFIEHLSKVAIPMFLQGRHPRDYEIKRDIYIDKRIRIPMH